MNIAIAHPTRKQAFGQQKKYFGPARAGGRPADHRWVLLLGFLLLLAGKSVG